MCNIQSIPLFFVIFAWYNVTKNIVERFSVLGRVDFGYCFGYTSDPLQERNASIAAEQKWELHQNKQTKATEIESLGNG